MFSLNATQTLFEKVTFDNFFLIIFYNYFFSYLCVPLCLSVIKWFCVKKLYIIILLVLMGVLAPLGGRGGMNFCDIFQ
jgi:hypothetical protein